MIYLFLVFASLTSFATSDIKCEGTYDHVGITRQKVNSINDFYYCFGYHHGRDRAWMMDYFRRVGQGRNAEIYGYTSLKSDLMMRLLDLPRLASKLYAGLPEQNKEWLKAYAKGANLGFVEGKNSHEFKDLNYAPEEWEPEHSVLVLVLQSFDQTRKTFFRDYEEEQFKEHWKEKAEDLFNDDNVPWSNTILKTGEYEVKKKELKTTYTPHGKHQLWENFPEVFGKESGSNNWVVSKNKSKSGHAMLANDPHLDLKTPLFWYWINLQSQAVNVIGGSIPGVPIVISGTNGKVAWGLTNAYINTADAVFLKDYPEDHLVTFRPTVKVRLGFLQIPFFFKSFEKTKNGDVILPLEVDNEDKMVLRWTGFDLESHDLISMFNLVNIKNVTEMDENLKQVGLPAWNFVFADTKGDIGYRVVGKAYKDSSRNSLGIASEEFEKFNKKKELLDIMERPHVLKPKRNYVYSANNRHWPVDAKFYGGRAYSYSFRGFRIDELLKDVKHDLESFKKIQCDRQVVDARFFVPKLLKIADIIELKSWDYNAQENSVAPSIYRRLMDLLMEGWQVNEFGLFNLLDNLSDKQKGELASFYKVAKEQTAGREWSSFHRLTFTHLSKNDDWKFSPEIPGIGDNHSVDPGTSKWDPDNKSYEQFSGASMRMIIVMKEVPEIHLSLPGYNRNYTQQQPEIPSWAEWRSCLYNKISFH